MAAAATKLYALATSLLLAGACGSQVAQGQSSTDARPHASAPKVSPGTAATPGPGDSTPVAPPRNPITEAGSAPPPASAAAGPGTATGAQPAKETAIATATAAGEPGSAGVDGRAESDADTADTPKPLINPIPLYDPSGHAMAPFHTALRSIERDGKTVRIAFFGASHVASDLFTDVIRKRLQVRFGDAGPGFVAVGKPWRWHRHGGVVYPRTRNFRTLRVLARKPEKDHYGLAGVALESGRLRATARVATRPRSELDGRIDHIELYYLKQPRGGRARVLVDGKGVATIRTAADARAPGYLSLDVPLAPHALEIRTQADGPVRLFGAALEKTGPGVVLDTLGIPGSRARNHLYWDDTLYRAQIAHRPAELFVLAYGTNESGDDDVPIELYEKRGRRVLTRLKALLPEAACLLIGPSDRPLVDEQTGEMQDRPRTLELVAAQQRLAAEFGCGFFDMVAFMGGPMSMPRWVAARPPLGTPDHIHFTRRGYEALGDAVYDAIMAGFDEPQSVAGAL